MLKLKYPDKHLFMLSANLVRTTSTGIEMSILQASKISINQEEAIGSFVLEIPTTKPGFSISQVLCLQIAWDSLLEDASKFEFN